jgi:hypothetical protein
MNSLGSRSAGQEGDLGLAARRARRVGGRPEGAVGDQVHGRGKRGGLAHAARRSHPARIAEAGAGRRRRRARPRKGAGGARHGDPALVHKHRNLLAHAPERLHEEISNNYKDMTYAQTKPEVEARRKAFIRIGRLKCRAVADSPEEAGDRLFTFTRFPPSQWKSIRTSNAIERLHGSSSAGSRPRPCCPAPRPPPCCSGRCLPQDRSPFARAMDGRPWRKSQTIRSLTSPYDRITSYRPKTRQQIPTRSRDGTMALPFGNRSGESLPYFMGLTFDAKSLPPLGAKVTWTFSPAFSSSASIPSGRI